MRIAEISGLMLMATLSDGFIEAPKTGLRTSRSFHERDFFESIGLRRAGFERVLQI